MRLPLGTVQCHWPMLAQHGNDVSAQDALLRELCSLSALSIICGGLLLLNCPAGRCLASQALRIMIHTTGHNGAGRPNGTALTKPHNATCS